MGAKLYLYRPILLAKVDQVRFFTIWIQDFRGHLQRFTPAAGLWQRSCLFPSSKPSSSKVSQNPNNSESYTLQNLIRPIGVSTYRVTRELPEPVREELPSVEDLQEVVNKLRSEMETLRKELADEE
jgi:hypothetical protein